MSWASTWVSCINKKNSKKNSTMHSFFEMCCLHRHTECENQLIALEEQHPLKLYPYSRMPPDHGSWDKWDTAVSTGLSSPSATQRTSAHIQMEINSVTSSETLLALFKCCQTTPAFSAVNWGGCQWFLDWGHLCHPCQGTQHTPCRVFFTPLLRSAEDSKVCLLCGHSSVIEWNLDSSFQKHF